MGDRLFAISINHGTRIVAKSHFIRPALPLNTVMQIATIKDLVTVLVAVFGVPSGLLTAWKAVNEMKRGRHENARQTAEKAKENRLKQAMAARDALSQIFSSHKSKAALQMVDWSGRIYSDGKQEFTIAFEELRPALRVDNLSFDIKEQFIRECFDDLFSNLELLQHYVDIELIHSDDVMVPLSYYAKRIAGNPKTFYAFLTDYGYTRAKKLLQHAA